jgi:iron complex transport system substrate-binding protein
LTLGGIALLRVTPLAVPARAASVVDARGRSVPVADSSRLVCIGGTITEIVYALGAQERVVAVDSTSQFPPAALRDKRNIGYMRNLSAEGVLAIDPTLLLVMEGAGPPQAIDALLASNVPLLFVDDTPTQQGVLGRVRFIAGVLDLAECGEQLCRTIEAGFTNLAAWRAAHLQSPRVLFVLSLRNGRPIVAGTGTAADAIIALAGGLNAAAGVQGYKPVSDEALITFAPDAILAMEHAGPALADDVLDLPAFRLTPAGARHALIRMDGELLLGFGPRTPQAALELAKRLVDATSPT